MIPIRVTLKKEIYQEMANLAKKDGVTISALLRQFIRLGLDADRRKRNVRGYKKNGFTLAEDFLKKREKRV